MPPADAFDIRAVHAQHEFRASGERSLDFRGIEAVDGDAEAVFFQQAYRVADTFPDTAGVAAEVDHVGPAVAELPRRGEDHFGRLICAAG